MKFDTVVAGGAVALPGSDPVPADVGIADGRIAAVGRDLAPSAGDVVDATGRLVLPGAIDAHYHLGIYRSIAEDAESETLSSLAGGVTTVLSYFRTGSHYLNKTGPYEEIFPEVLAATSGHSHVDYGFHLAPMDASQVREIPRLVDAHGVTSFKYYMFYKGLDLSGAGDANAERMSETYDLGHLFEIMEAVAAAGAARSAGRRVSLSIHAEQPELIRLFMERVRTAGALTGLEAYSAGRPPLTERLAIAEAGVLASATACPVNFLHLSSADALDAAVGFERAYRDLDVRLEVTLHHLALSYETYSDQRGKVNPPIRSEADREALWAGVLRGDVDWIVSDHACCSESNKEGDMWAALPGFGGSALMYPYLLTEGRRRGLPIRRIVELVATNPARAYGLAGRKGSITVGADADLAIVDLETRRTVTPEVLLSAQEYTPFEGMELSGWPERTLLRGRVAFEHGEAVGGRDGVYLKAPQRTPTEAAA
jgi:dihydroorotase (multifunctional complex type)